MPIKITTTTEPDVKQFVKDMKNSIPKTVVRNALRGIAKQVRNLLMGESPTGISDTPPVSPTFKPAWSGLKKVDGGRSYYGNFAWENPTKYGYVIEEGRFRSSMSGLAALQAAYSGGGKRTITTGSGTYSKQAIGGVMKPLVFDDDTLVDLIADAVQTKIIKHLEGFRKSSG